MANAQQLKALFRAYLSGDDQHFHSVALQVAAHEAKRGHGKLAKELRDLIDKAKFRPHGLEDTRARQPIPINRPRGELAGLVAVSYPKIRLSHMVLAAELSEQLQRVVLENRQAAHIREHGLSPRRKLLLMGEPGTGKTMTASALAGELGLPMMQVRLDGLITKYMGETAAKLRQVFDLTERTRAVYFFDEFDAIGSQRGLANDVGEARRILNSFLLMIEQDQSHSLIVAATNHPEILDHALFRRFDDVLHYDRPDERQAAFILRSRLQHVAEKSVVWDALAKEFADMSHADLTRVADEVLKAMLIEGRSACTEQDIRDMLAERQRSVVNLASIN